MAIRRTQPKRARNYLFLVYLVVLFGVLQFLALMFFHQELISRPPSNLFSGGPRLPLEELTLRYSDEQAADIAIREELPQAEEETEEIPEPIIEEETIAGPDPGDHQILITDTQREIVSRALELLEEGMAYDYTVYPDTGYPEGNTGISTDVISIVLRDSGFDLMELIYEDMADNTGSYRMDLVGRDNPVKHIDFRHVFFQETFFSRHALEVDEEYDPDDEANHIQWQAGDIVYFEMETDRPHQNLGGIISPNTNDDGVPLVIMNSKELGQVSEVDVLLEYDIIGHYRYPDPED